MSASAAPVMTAGRLRESIFKILTASVIRRPIEQDKGSLWGRNMRLSSTKLFLASVLATLFVEAGAACPIEQPAVRTCEFIFDSVSFPFSHASTIVETKNALLAAWYGGSREGAEDVQIWSARQENGKWSAPTVLATGMRNGNGTLPTLESRIVPLSKRSADAVL